MPSIQNPILAPLIEEGLLEDFLLHLGFILANDHCRRGCFHCPAYGDTSPLQYMPFAVLHQVIETIGQAYTQCDMYPQRSIASWRISDPFDYYVREHGEQRTTYDVARLWQRYLGQGLYIVTNGTEGKQFAREALVKLVHEIDLVSQIKLTITPYDALWGSPNYVEDIVWDVRTLAPLWNIPSTRAEDSHGSRFRINVKTTEETKEAALTFLRVFESLFKQIANKRLTISPHGPRMGTANMRKLSPEIVHAIQQADCLFIKGSGIHEMFQGEINKHCYTAYVLAREFNESESGLDVRSGPFLFFKTEPGEYSFWGFKGRNKRTKRFPDGREIAICLSTIEEHEWRKWLTDSESKRKAMQQLLSIRRQCCGEYSIEWNNEWRLVQRSISS